MTNHTKAFTKEARAAAWDDITPALIYADYLEERGAQHESELVRWAASVAHDSLVTWLSRFSADWGGYRYASIVEPFVRDGYIYATDARIAVRVRALTGDTPRPKEGRTPDVREVFERYCQPNTLPWLAWPTKPVVVPTPDTETGVVCPICRGDGHYFADGDDVYCVYCDHTGYVERIEGCVKLGDELFAGRYWHLISQLPSVVYREPQSSEYPLWFRFLGGDGLLTSMEKAQA